MNFEDPKKLILIALIPLLLYYYFGGLHKKERAALKFGNFETLRKITVHGVLLYKNYIPLALRCIALLCFIVALAGPQTFMKVEAAKVDVVLAIDVSGSMQVKDYAPNRLEAAKSAAQLFVAQLEAGDRVGVVTFSGASHITAPISSDYEGMLSKISKISFGAEDGTAIGDGLLTSASLLSGSEGRKKAVVLLSDGENNRGVAPLDAAQYSKDTEIIVYTVGIGSKEGAFLPGGQRTGLDENTLRSIAHTTGGEYYAAVSEDMLREIYSNIAVKIIYEEKSQDLSKYFINAGIALLVLDFMLASTRYRTLPCLILFCLMPIALAEESKIPQDIPNASQPVQRLYVETPQKEDYTSIGISLVALFFALLFALIAYKLLRKKKTAPPYIAKLTDTEDRIFESLVKAKSLFYSGKIKEAFEKISVGLKKYLEKKYLAGKELTTKEYLEFLKNRVDEKLFENVKKVLEMCDLVKFARYTPSGEEFQEIAYTLGEISKQR